MTLLPGNHLSIIRNLDAPLVIFLNLFEIELLIQNFTTNFFLNARNCLLSQKILKSLSLSTIIPNSSQYSLKGSLNGGAWWAAVHGVAMSRTQLSDFTFTFHFHALEKEMATHCLENPRDGGAWWAAVYRAAQSWTQLKSLSSSSKPLLAAPGL